MIILLEIFLEFFVIYDKKQNNNQIAEIPNDIE